MLESFKIGDKVTVLHDGVSKPGIIGYAWDNDYYEVIINQNKEHHIPVKVCIDVHFSKITKI